MMMMTRGSISAEIAEIESLQSQQGNLCNLRKNLSNLCKISAASWKNLKFFIFQNFFSKFFDKNLFLSERIIKHQKLDLTVQKEPLIQNFIFVIWNLKYPKIPVFGQNWWFFTWCWDHLPIKIKTGIKFYGDF